MQNVFAANSSFGNNSDNNIALFNVDHKTSPARRTEILRDARGLGKSLITNCKLFATEIGHASWDLVVIADPVRSSVDGRQMIGRVGRKAPGKERGYVLVPVPISNRDVRFDKDSHAYQIFVNTFNHMVNLDQELCQDVVFVIEKSSKTLIDP